MGKQGFNGRPSNQFGSGQKQPHTDGLGFSGQEKRNQGTSGQRQPRRTPSLGESIANYRYGKGPVNMTHGKGKKKR